MDVASTTAPTPSPQHMQALDALEQANHVRLARAALKRSIKAGELNAAEVVRSSPWEVETMTVSELLRSQRRWGRTRTQKFLTLLAVGENRQVGRLTDRQRELLASHLEEKARFAH